MLGLVMAPMIDDRYNKLRRDIGNDFSKRNASHAIDDETDGGHSTNENQNSPVKTDGTNISQDSSATQNIIGFLRVKELYSFHCGSCGYTNIHEVDKLNCGCGKTLHGRQVYRKVGDTVIFDTRNSRKLHKR